MNAGRELDALVAEKLFGWEGIERVECSRCGIGEGADLHGYYEDSSVLCIPKYSTDIAAAWEVLDHVYKTSGFQEISILRFSESDGWEVRLGKPGSRTRIEAHVSGSMLNHENVAQAAPLAICLAALKAVGAL